MGQKKASNRHGWVFWTPFARATLPFSACMHFRGTRKDQPLLLYLSPPPRSPHPSPHHPSHPGGCERHNPGNTRQPERRSTVSHRPARRTHTASSLVPSSQVGRVYRFIASVRGCTVVVPSPIAGPTARPAHASACVAALPQSTLLGFQNDRPTKRNRMRVGT
jgi:hypothetical protein